MKFATLLARKSLVTAVIVFCIAIGTGHVMQTVLADRDNRTDTAPSLPSPPEEALTPVVLKTPPAPQLPETFG